MVDGVTYLPLPGAKPHRDRAAGDRASTRLRSFVVDDANADALYAVDALLGSPTVPPPIVLLHGPSGVGKTHLAHALARSWQQSHAGARVIAMTGADFARNFESRGIDNIEPSDEAITDRPPPKSSTVAWNLTSLFVLDNIDDLTDKPAAQRELCAALDQLTSSGGRAIITSRCKPVRDEQLSAALVSRLNSGLVISLAKLSKPGRRAVIAELALARGLSLSIESIDRLAASTATTVPELAGLIVQLDMTARTDHRQVDETFVRNHVTVRETKSPTVQAIAELVAEHFDVTLADLRGPVRRKAIVSARSVAIYLTRELTDDSLQAIGRYFGNRDHATIAYNIEKVASELASGEPATCQAVKQIRDALESIA